MYDSVYECVRVRACHHTQTGYAKVFVEIDFYMSNARLLFDSGSQRSYITKSLKGCLKLRCVRKERLIIKTFGVNESCLEDIEVVQLKVRKCLSGQNGRYIHLELLVVPDICSPLSDQCPKLVKSRCPHLRNLYLSDFVNCTDSDGMNRDILVI